MSGGVKWPHGTETGYSSNGCRCEDCRIAHGQRVVAWQRANRKQRREPPVHGLTGYIAYGCRCDVCTTARREQERRYRARLKAEATA